MAQLDSAMDSDSRGWGFESLRAGQSRASTRKSRSGFLLFQIFDARVGAASFLSTHGTSERVALVPIFYFIKNQSPAPLFLLSRKRSRSHRLTACKRAVFYADLFTANLLRVRVCFKAFRRQLFYNIFTENRRYIRQYAAFVFRSEGFEP